LNFLIPDTTGAAHESDNTQIVLAGHVIGEIEQQVQVGRLPLPDRIRSRIFVVHAVPSRHWVHWAHDSCA